LGCLQQPDGPQLAILDWMMPGLNGVDVCRGVRAAGREPYVYILLLTARADSQDWWKAMEAGADDYLTKPFQAHELRVRLRAGRRILNCNSSSWRRAKPCASRPLTTVSPACSNRQRHSGNAHKNSRARLAKAIPYHC